MFVAFFQILLVNDVIAAMDPKERSTLWETLTKEEPKPLETNA
jgi:hypothetical protein